MAVTERHLTNRPPEAGTELGNSPSPRRSKRAHEAILNAAAELIHERPYSDVCIEAIAARAGVGKQTIYRWWTSKAAVLMEACAAVVAREVPLPDKGSFIEDFRDYLNHICGFFTNQLSRPAIAGLLAEAQCNAELAVAFKERLLMQRRKVLNTILDRAVARGELRPALDLDVIMDMVHGAIWYRTLLLKAPLDEAFVKSVIAQVMAGCAAAPKLAPDKPVPPA
jgi:AcrR family transcriptional regulator